MKKNLKNPEFKKLYKLFPLIVKNHKDNDQTEINTQVEDGNYRKYIKNVNISKIYKIKKKDESKKSIINISSTSTDREEDYIFSQKAPLETEPNERIKTQKKSKIYKQYFENIIDLNYQESNPLLLPKLKNKILDESISKKKFKLNCIKEKKLNQSFKQIKFNSTKYKLEKDTQINETKILNRYYPNLEEFMTKKEYSDYICKRNTNIRSTSLEVKKIYKNAKVLDTICDCLNINLFKLYRIKENNKNEINQELKNKIIQNKIKKQKLVRLKNNLLNTGDIYKLKITRTETNKDFS